MKNIRICTIAVLSVLIILSCRKPTLIGDDLIPEQDMMHSTRVEQDLITSTHADDSTITTKNLFYAVGRMQQESYGETNAGLYLQISLPTNNLDLGDTLTADSAVLILDYAGLYGDTLAAHTVNVYRMEEQMESSDYFSDTRFTALPLPIGKKENFVPDLDDSIDVYKFTFQPHLRIRLSQEFANDLISQDSTVFASDTTFENWLNGLYVTENSVTDDSGSIMLFDLSTLICGVALYFKTSEVDSQVVTFPISKKVNYFSHTHSVTVQAHLDDPEPPDGNDVTYVQGFAGLRTHVEVPSLDTFQNVSINKAELYFPVSGFVDSTITPPPPSVVLLAADSLGRNSFVFDYVNELYYSVVDQFVTSSNYGGSLVYETNRYGVMQYMYKFDLTREFQSIIDGRLENRGFNVICYPTYRIPNAVTLGGTANVDPNLHPYVSITYTFVNK